MEGVKLKKIKIPLFIEINSLATYLLLPHIVGGKVVDIRYNVCKDKGTTKVYKVDRRSVTKKPCFIVENYTAVRDDL